VIDSQGALPPSAESANCSTSVMSSISRRAVSQLAGMPTRNRLLSGSRSQTSAPTAYLLDGRAEFLRDRVDITQTQVDHNAV
jgi:hypothetical protein